MSILYFSLQSAKIIQCLQRMCVKKVVLCVYLLHILYLNYVFNLITAYRKSEARYHSSTKKTAGIAQEGEGAGFQQLILSHGPFIGLISHIVSCVAVFYLNVRLYSQATFAVAPCLYMRVKQDHSHLLNYSQALCVFAGSHVSNKLQHFLLILDEKQSTFPGSSTADISPRNLRKALPMGCEERDRKMDCSAVCSVLTGS